MNSLHLRTGLRTIDPIFFYSSGNVKKQVFLDFFCALVYFEKTCPMRIDILVILAAGFFADATDTADHVEDLCLSYIGQANRS